MPTSSDGSVLWLSNETPDIRGQGGQRRQYFLIRELVRQGCDVHVMTVVSEQDDSSVRRLAPVTRVRRYLPGGIRNPLSWRSAERSALSGEYSHVVVSHLESWRLLGDQPGPAPLPVPVLVDIHNVLSVWHEHLGNAGQAQIYRRLEQEVLATAHSVAVCSQAELDRLPGRGPSHRMVVPHGIDTEQWNSDPSGPGAQVVAMFGSWGWHPNRRGLNWFLDQVWTRLLTEYPQAECHVAGTDIDPSVGSRPGVVVRGRVADLVEFTQEARAVVVPVLDGVGASVKFADSLASGRAVIATSDAASAHPGTPALVSDDPAAWVEALRTWMSDPCAAIDVGVRGRRYALDHLSWSKVADPLVQWVRTTS